jgi:hypothetical protein
MFFQNVFESDFVGMLVLGDRQHSLSFRVAANRNRSTLMQAYGTAPYNTVGNTTLTINVSINGGRSYIPLAITLTSGAAQSIHDIVSDLNSNGDFSNFFTADTAQGVVTVKAKYTRENFRAYVNNTSAETVLKFNRYCGVAELPDYFERHTISNYVAGTYSDSVGSFVKLTQPTDNQIITDAGLSTTAKSDYELLRGRSGLFKFVKNTVDSSNRITTSIEYSAGAQAGDLAKKTTYSYTSTKTNPDVSAEIPYVLQTADLVTPP